MDKPNCWSSAYIVSAILKCTSTLLTEENMFVDEHFWRAGSITTSSSSDEAFQHLGVLNGRIYDVKISVWFRQQATTGYGHRVTVEPRHYAVWNLHFQRATRNARYRPRQTVKYVLCNDNFYWEIVRQTYIIIWRNQLGKYSQKGRFWYRKHVDPILLRDG